MKVIAIDGPAGAGKTTVARELSRILGYTLIDTGALYRGVALRAREKKVPWTDGSALADLIAVTSFGFDDQGLVLDGLQRDHEIRTQAIGMGASDVSKHPEVRTALLELQRSFAETEDVVMEGRDIGSAIFPDADLKVFLTATLDERARRRCAQLANDDFDTVKAQIAARDHQDTTREVAPLVPSRNAIIVDTTKSSIEDVVGVFVGMVKNGISGRWGNRFLEMAVLVAGWSKDPSTKVGCVVVGPDREVRSTGFNGFPRGISDDCRLDDRALKYPIVCHAEENVVAQAARIGVQLKDCTAYVTFPPCSKCARMLIQSGISVVSYPAGVAIPDRWKDDVETSLLLLAEAGVHVMPIAR